VLQAGHHDLVQDHRIFANREVPSAARASPLRGLRQVPWFLAEFSLPDEAGATSTLEDCLSSTRTAAFIVLPGIEVLDHHTHQHLWWTPHGGQGDFYACGRNGQYLCVNPDARLVIVKFSETNRQDPVPMFRALAAAVTAPTHLAEIDRLDSPLLASR
jgi:hypothetical protein